MVRKINFRRGPKREKKFNHGAWSKLQKLDMCEKLIFAHGREKKINHGRSAAGPAKKRLITDVSCWPHEKKLITQDPRTTKKRKLNFRIELESLKGKTASEVFPHRIGSSAMARPAPSGNLAWQR